MLALEVLRGPDTGRRFELPANEPQLIGRSSEALPITDTTVSRRHAELTPDGGAWFIRDLDSANGSYVNGRRIRERTRLEPGDQIRVGNTLLLLGAATPSSPETVNLLDDSILDVTIESSADPNDDSLVLGAPDPVRTASEHLRVIYELTRIASEALDEGALLERTMDLLMEEFRPDRAFLLRGELDGGPLIAAVVRSREPLLGTGGGAGGAADIAGSRIPVSRTIIKHVRETGEGVLSTNAMNDDRFAAGDSVSAYGIHSAICVPIAAGDRMLGVIHVDSQLANFTFTEEQLALLRAFGRLTAVALGQVERVEARVQEERLAAMGQTVASLSHSIKNILQGLRGGADAVGLALDRDNLDLAREGWPILARNLDRILNLTMNMLAYSRETGVDIELMDVADLIEDVRELVARHCEARRIALIVDPDEHMPPVPTDPAGLHQVLMNLLMNAVEAAPAKRGVVTIGSRFHADRGTWEIFVADNGPGMTDAEQARAFVPFASTKGQRGTGLGLAVTRKIVEQHGGKVTIETAPGEGTTVRAVMPADRRAGDSSATHHPEPNRPRTGPIG